MNAPQHQWRVRAVDALGTVHESRERAPNRAAVERAIEGRHGVCPSLAIVRLTPSRLVTVTSPRTGVLDRRECAGSLAYAKPLMRSAIGVVVRIEPARAPA